MRDDTSLYAALYRPLGAAADAAFPTLLIRSPYSTQHERYMAWTVAFAAAGYAVVQNDCRGRYESDGVWRPYVDETEDGYDTQEWIGAQPWCE
jgi:putative CocE/NonD family hydrolase